MFEPIADWRNESEYPSANVRARRWAFEFLRRNHQYQKDFREYLSVCESIVPGFNPYAPPDVNDDEKCRLYEKLEQGFCSDEFLVYDPPMLEGESLTNYEYRIKRYTRSPLASVYARKWGLNNALFDPFATLNHGCSFEKSSTKTSRVGPGWDGFKYIQTTYHAAPYLIDCRIPIKPQIKAIEKQALKHQAWLIKKGHLEPIPEKRKRTKLYPEYLRCLDAKDASASVEDMIAVLCPHMDNSYPDYPANKTIANWLEAAEKLRDKDYIYLPMLE